MQDYVKCVYEVCIQRITLHFGYFVHTCACVCVSVCGWVWGRMEAKHRYGCLKQNVEDVRRFSWNT